MTQKLGCPLGLPDGKRRRDYNTGPLNLCWTMRPFMKLENSGLSPQEKNAPIHITKNMHTISGDLSTDVLRVHKSKVSQRNKWNGSEVRMPEMRICSRKKNVSLCKTLHKTIRIDTGPNNFLNYKVL